MAIEELDSSKIDGLVEVGPATNRLAASLVNGMVEVGAKTSTIEVAKIDSFTMLSSAPAVQHEHIFTDQWIGPPKVPGT